ncbi:MAG: hypothetical protein QM729_12110 [Solirubrobacterales bacterium]
MPWASISAASSPAWASTASSLASASARDEDRIPPPAAAISS